LSYTKKVGGNGGRSVLTRSF